MINKEAKDKQSSTIDRLPVRNAREGLRLILVSKLIQDSNTVLLMPSYIGWSPNEGSGLMDPVLSAGMRYVFYELSDELLPDTESLNKALTSHEKPLLLLVHYFGRRTNLSDSTLTLIQENGIGVIEDWAHDLSRLVHPRVRICEDQFEIFSMHKWIATEAGGVVRGDLGQLAKSPNGSASDTDLKSFVATDLHSVFQIRWQNYRKLSTLLIDSSKYKTFWSDLSQVTCPLNFPIRLNSKDDRHSLYKYLTEHGIHPTALYHTLVNQLHPSRFPESFKVSDTILNLPIHQDCSKRDLEYLCHLTYDWAQATV